MHLWERYHIHGDFIKIDVQVSFESHGASQVIDDICNYGVLFLEVILLTLLITAFKDR